MYMYIYICIWISREINNAQHEYRDYFMVGECVPLTYTYLDCLL